MGLSLRQVEELKKQTEIKWYLFKNPNDPAYEKLYSTAFDNFSMAQSFIRRLEQPLKSTAEIVQPPQSISSNPKQFCVLLNGHVVKAMLETGRVLCTKKDPAIYTVVNRDPAGDIQFENSAWEQLGADINFADSNTTKFVSLEQRTKQFLHTYIDTESEMMLRLKNTIMKKCTGKPVEEILKIVVREVDNLTAKHQRFAGLQRHQIESKLNEMLSDYEAQRAQGDIPGKPADLKIPLEENIEAGILVCAHKGMIAASMLGHLIKSKILPEGSARYYRTELQDRQDGQAIGGHAFAVYYDAQNDKRWVVDPRWLAVTEVTYEQAQDEAQLMLQSINKYGRPAARKLKERCVELDLPIAEKQLSKQLKSSKTLEEFYQYLERHFSHYPFRKSDGLIVPESEKHNILEVLKNIFADPIVYDSKQGLEFIENIQDNMTLDLGLREHAVRLLMKKVNPTFPYFGERKFNQYEMDPQITIDVVEQLQSSFSTLGQKPIQSTMIMDCLNWALLDGQKRFVAHIEKIADDFKSPIHEIKQSMTAFIDGEFDANMLMEQITSNVLPLGVRNREGQTPLHWAIENDQNDLVDFLLEHPAMSRDIINIKDKNLNNVAHLAAMKKNYELLDRVKNKGALTQVPNINKHTALKIKEFNDFDIESGQSRDISSSGPKKQEVNWLKQNIQHKDSPFAKKIDENKNKDFESTRGPLKPGKKS